MKHLSVPISSVEIVELSPLDYSPLISKCTIKVCYVSDEPNRNHSIITKETAKSMAPSLRGCPIVGYFNKEENDYEEHSREISFEDNNIEFIDKTKPYGFVDLNAKVWFQTFLDDNEVEREYLMTEGYLWTEQYEEAKRIIKNGNNQSMELDPNTLNASWTKKDKNNMSFFIINEANISKLCILGEEYEPCFEGAQIYSFKEQLFSIVKEMKDILQRGETQMENEKEVVVTAEEEAVVEETVAVEEEVVTEEETTVEEEVVEEEATEFKKKEEEEEDKNDKEEASENEDNTDDKKEDEEEEDEDKKKKKYSLDEIPEYQELSARAADLEKVIAEYELKVQEYETQISELSEFKLSVEKKEKEALIEQFYMVSEEDKKDIIDNIDTYSYDEIKSKLSVFCFDNGINFSGKEEEEEPIAYNLTSDTGCTTPDWVKAALETQKELEY